jgi:hypothetical protein
LKFPGVPLSLHCGSFPGNCAPFLCVSSRVHSNSPSALGNQGLSASKANGFNGTYGRGGGDRNDKHLNKACALNALQPPTLANWNKRNKELNWPGVRPSDPSVNSRGVKSNNSFLWRQLGNEGAAKIPCILHPSCTCQTQIGGAGVPPGSPVPLLSTFAVRKI